MKDTNDRQAYQVCMTDTNAMHAGLLEQQSPKIAAQSQVLDPFTNGCCLPRSTADSHALVVLQTAARCTGTRFPGTVQGPITDNKSRGMEHSNWSFNAALPLRGASFDAYLCVIAGHRESRDMHACVECMKLFTRTRQRCIYERHVAKDTIQSVIMKRYRATAIRYKSWWRFA